MYKNEPKEMELIIHSSLPELATSMVAAKKNEMDMAVGNVVGSNIFNVLLILGTAAAISPVALITENLIDVVILVVASVILLIFGATAKRLDRKEGVIMLLSYAAFLGYIIARTYM